MLTKSSLIRSFSLFLFACLFAACSDTDETINVEEFVDDTVMTINRNANAGPHGCFEFVFPVSVTLPDGSNITAESYDDLKAQVRAWKEANPDIQGKPSLDFPIELITEEGDLMTIESKIELKLFIRACKKDMAHQGPHSLRCFKLVFPVSIQFPDQSTIEVGSRKDAKMAIRAWKKDNPDSEERPSLVFPVSVEMEDGTIVEVGSSEELKALKDACSE